MKEVKIQNGRTVGERVGNREIIHETDNTVFYKSKLGGIDYRFKPKNPDDIIEAVINK